jgi:glycosyltransferase involved in cell wall biosynthesis
MESLLPSPAADGIAAGARAIDPSKAPVSVVISAYNEAAQIADCVGSVSWAREVIVVENESKDDTARVAREAGATVITNTRFVNVEDNRNQGIARVANEWVLVLDADERSTPEVERDVRAIVSAPSPEFEAYRIKRINYFLGKLIRYGGWERDRPVRLFRRHLRYTLMSPHGHVDVKRAGVLEGEMVHYPYTDLASYFEKLTRYSAVWAQHHFAEGRRTGIANVAVRPPLRFLTMYVLRRGFLDGAHGVLVAALAAVSVAAKYARLWELTINERRNGPPN